MDSQQQGTVPATQFSTDLPEGQAQMRVLDLDPRQQEELRQFEVHRLQQLQQ